MILAYYDTECYPNLWLLKFRPKGGDAFTFRIGAGERFNPDTAARIARLFDLFCVVSFNGNHYDVPMIACALHGYTCEQLKWVNDAIIMQQQKPWEMNLPEWKPVNHIDIIEVLPGSGSQKLYAGRIHYKTMRDLPYDPDTVLSAEQIAVVDSYCENDLGQIEAEHDALIPQLDQRVQLGDRYGLDLRSKSDAQLAEVVLKRRCEQATGRRIYKPEIDWNLNFRYEPPEFLSFSTPALLSVFENVKASIFELGANGAVAMPAQLDGLQIGIGASVYKMGIGGLHSSEKCRVYRSNETHVLRDIDVASYYPSLILNSGRFPRALGITFLQEYAAIRDERLAAKKLESRLRKETGRDTKSPEFPEGYKAHCENEGGKIQLNGTFGKTGSPYSVLFAPEMLIQTTITGQLAILMLIEWFEHYGISVVSANTDGIVSYCERSKLHIADHLIKEWEKLTGLDMEATDYAAIYSRDVNNYIAVKMNGESPKRKGEYSRAGLIEKKNPDCEICSDAVAEYIWKGTPLYITIAGCTDIRKFVKIQRVSGGAVKLWGEGPRKDARVRDMIPVLEANGWSKAGRLWSHPSRDVKEILTTATAYALCFQEQRSEYMGKVVRWYYGTNSPGPIVYASNGNTVSLSYGATPCMTLPDQFPSDIDYGWYIRTAQEMLKELNAA